MIFFFFQAEDGIRDLTVTGVQTCALPIFPLTGVTGARHAVLHRVLERGRVVARRKAPLGARQVERHDARRPVRSEEHTSELQSQSNLVCRLLLEKKKS